MKYIKIFNNIRMADLESVGGKNASLGQMIHDLNKKNIKIPNGFASTAEAYWHFIDSSNLRKPIQELMAQISDSKDTDMVKKISSHIRKLIESHAIPSDLEKEITSAYKKLCKNKNCPVAVRSSATAEDLPTASFAGQQETFLNVRGTKELLNAWRKCVSSLFTPRAIVYRINNKFDYQKIALSVGVQEMIESSVSGVSFTVDTETGFKDVVFINSAYGLGENIVQGKVNPDEFYVHKPTLEEGYKPILSKTLGSKKIKAIYAQKGIKNITVPQKECEQFSLTDNNILNIARMSIDIEKLYSQKNKKWTPMDIEWAKDKKGIIYIVQARPETVQSQKKENILIKYTLTASPQELQKKLLLTGQSVGQKIATGSVCIIKNIHESNQMKDGAILVTSMTDPDWVPIMKKATAIITDRGGRTCFSGETLIATNEGIITFQDLYQKIKNNKILHVLGYDEKENATVWKKIKSIKKTKNKTILRISISQTGKSKYNTLDVTPDHKFYTYKNRTLIKKTIKEILQNQEIICLLDQLPLKKQTSKISPQLAYLLGALASDGNIHLHPGIKKEFRRGTITFTQKDVYVKKEFIKTVKEYFKKIFGKELQPKEKISKETIIRGKKVLGSATDFRCYSLPIALQIKHYLETLPIMTFSFSETVALCFLAGLLDGDGSFYNNRINIYIGKKNILEAAVLSCLKLGFVPQVTSNRTIYNVQIVEKVNDILFYSKKIKKKALEKKLGTKLFAAKQLFGDIINQINYKGRIKTYINKNLLLDARKIEKFILPKTKDVLYKEIEKIIHSPIRMQRVKLIEEINNIDVFNMEVEASHEIDHNYVVFSKRLSPILVSNCHAAIVSRELGIPAIVGTEKGTSLLKNNQIITIDCSQGETGYIYEGTIPFTRKEVHLKKLPKIPTKILLNIAQTERAFALSFLPVQGVGLARLEFIISHNIKIHPLALLKQKNLPASIVSQIKKLIVAYKNPEDYFVDILAEEVATIAAAFWPNEVIVRLSDFKSNEYRDLLGGTYFEPHEENPMLGLRGASRYYSDFYKDAFILECKALKKARTIKGFKNIKIMIPFVRTVEEAQKTINIMKQHGLHQGKENLELVMMCEVPSNVILIDQFSKLFDGFSIGSNDLTQLTLGVDRDAASLAKLFDERDEAVKKLIEMAITGAHKNKRFIGICGQAPSDYLDFGRWLIKEKIDSISLNPDAVIPFLQKINQH